MKCRRRGEGGRVRDAATNNLNRYHQRPPAPSNLRGGVAGALIIKTIFHRTRLNSSLLTPNSSLLTHSPSRPCAEGITFVKKTAVLEKKWHGLLWVQKIEVNLSVNCIIYR